MRYILFTSALLIFFFSKTTAQTCENYAEAMTKIFEKGIVASMPKAEFQRAMPEATEASSFGDFREEIVLNTNRNGLKNTTFYFDAEGDKPLYEMIFEFENADSVQLLAELMFGPPNHPNSEGRWVTGQTDDGVISVMWTFATKLVLVVNIPKTEYADDPMFDLPLNWRLDGGGGEAPQTPEEGVGAGTEVTPETQLNQFIFSALSDFSELKGEPLAGKKDAFFSQVQYIAAEETILKKTAAGNWRLEALLGNFKNLGAARAFFDVEKIEIENMKGMDFRLVKKSEYSTNTGSTYLWDARSADDKATGVLVKLQLFAAGAEEYGVRLEIGR